MPIQVVTGPGHGDRAQPGMGGGGGGGNHGFGILDLLVTLATIGFLAILALVTIGASRPNAMTLQCMNNLQRVTLAWRTYGSDNEDQVAGNYGIPGTEQAIQSRSFATWANNVLTWGASSQVIDVSNTNVDWVLKGPLGPYLGGSAAVYQCPADRYLSLAQRTFGYTRRVRSISMNSVFGHFGPPSDSTYQNPPRNWILTQYLQYLKLGSVLKPAKTWVFIEEHPDSINDGYFVNAPTATTWQDLPGSLHDGACGFSFADGHTEMKRWRSRSSIYPRVVFTYTNPKVFDPAGRSDFAWYLERTGYVDVNTGKPAFGY